jgi:hypothetical protein
MDNRSLQGILSNPSLTEFGKVHRIFSAHSANIQYYNEGSSSSDMCGQAAVFRYDLEYGLTEEETVAISDHYPVYAEFNVSGYVD